MKRTLLALLAAGILTINSCSDRPKINETRVLESKINSKMTIYETGKKSNLSDEEAMLWMLENV